MCIACTGPTQLPGRSRHAARRPGCAGAQAQAAVGHTTALRASRGLATIEQPQAPGTVLGAGARQASGRWRREPLPRVLEAPGAPQLAPASSLKCRPHVVHTAAGPARQPSCTLQCHRRRCRHRPPPPPRVPPTAPRLPPPGSISSSSGPPQWPPWPAASWPLCSTCGPCWRRRSARRWRRSGRRRRWRSRL